jgi:hypothetical protein
MLALASTASAVPTSGGIVIPPGDVATLSNAQFGSSVPPGSTPSDPLAYGYSLNGGSTDVAVDNNGSGGFKDAAGATIGPFSSPKTLLIYLTDNYDACDDTYYSDGSGDADHALVTQEAAPNTWGVSLMDSGVCGSMADTTRVPSADGLGNFNVTVTITPISVLGACSTLEALVQGSSAWKHASILQQELAYGPMAEACLAIEEISPRLSCSVNQGWVTNYENWVAVLVREGWLTSTQGSYLDASASALVPSCKVILKP